MVLASIKPVAMLIKAVAGDELTVNVLLPANISPHEYTLKFSDIRAVKQADLVVWVGPELEGVLVRVLRNIPSANVVQLMQLENMQWPNRLGENPREGHGHHVHGSDGSESQAQGERDDSYNRDPHLWLNPQNSLLAVEAIKTALINQYPERKTLFEENAQAFSEKISVLNQSISKNLEHVQATGFIVVHDGYGHFVDHYNLNQLAVIQLTGGAHRGARHYSEIIALGEKAACIYTEPQLNNKAAMQLAGKLGANHAELDLMGSNTQLSKNSYAEFIGTFAETFRVCLDRKMAK
jgi:zinc transport system substrate-binding protein